MLVLLDVCVCVCVLTFVGAHECCKYACVVGWWLSCACEKRGSVVVKAAVLCFGLRIE